MRRRLRKMDGKWVWETLQPEPEIAQILDMNHHIQSSATRPGGTGSENMRYVGRVPATIDAQWRAEWRKKGGHKGTGMSADEYCLLQMSKPEYNRFVVTPSGKTGRERKARRLTF
jgi:hypothetical protein